MKKKRYTWFRNHPRNIDYKFISNIYGEKALLDTVLELCVIIYRYHVKSYPIHNNMEIYFKKWELKNGISDDLMNSRIFKFLRNFENSCFFIREQQLLKLKGLSKPENDCPEDYVEGYNWERCMNESEAFFESDDFNDVNFPKNCKVKFDLDLWEYTLMPTYDAFRFGFDVIKIRLSSPIEYDIFENPFFAVYLSSFLRNAQDTALFGGNWDKLQKEFAQLLEKHSVGLKDYQPM